MSLRIPVELYKMLTEAAGGSSPPNTLTGEITDRLYASFDEQSRVDKMADRMAELQRRSDEAADEFMRLLAELQQRLEQVEERDQK